MQIGKAIVTSALAASVVSAPAFAGAEKLAISSAAAQSGEEGSGLSGTLIGVLAAAAIVGGIVVAASGDDDDPESP